MKDLIKRIGEKETAYVMEVLNAQFRTSSGGKMTERLEKAFAKKFGVKYAIAHQNGTCTMHSALVAAGIGPGDEVIVPPLTMSSTSFAVIQAGAKPVFADIEPDTFLISPKSIKERITPKTKAIIPVALYGLSPDFDAIMKIAKEHNLLVLEDDAQCFLGKYKGRLVGTFGQMASFSFQSSKQMTSGEGGMIITNDKKLADGVRCFSSLGYAGLDAEKVKITRKDIQDPDYKRHIMYGYNYRIPELCAAVALAQLERLDLLVQRRIDVANLYAEAVKNCKWLTPQKVPKDCVHSYWTYVIKLDTNKVNWHAFRDKFVELGGDGIYAAWALSYQEPAFKEYSHYRCPNAEEVQPKLLQFKTNYMDWSKAEEQANILKKTIAFFNKNNKK
jgi:perosamine synthetase